MAHLLTGMYNGARQSIWIPTNTYTEDKVPDLTGKVIIVTGANTGIGLETARVLLTKHAKVYIAARSPEKAQKAIEGLKKEIPDAKVEFLELDLADLKKTRKAAKEFLSREKRLDVLFNSGGVMVPPAHLKTADGYDLQFGTNVLGHFAFTTALLPVLLATAKKEKPKGGFVRVINTSSSAHLFATRDPCNPKDMGKEGYPTGVKYNESKIGNIFFSNELARRYKDAGIYSASLNPGNIRTELTRHVPSLAARFLHATFLYPVQLGAATQLYAGTSPSVALDQSGEYFIPWCRSTKPEHPDAQDPAIGERVWEWCEEQVRKVTGEQAVPSS